MLPDGQMPRPEHSHTPDAAVTLTPHSGGSSDVHEETSISSENSRETTPRVRR